MAVNKVVLGSETLIDLTEDTATAEDVAAGATLHLSNGLRATGTASYAGAPENNGNANKTNAILFGTVDSTSTATVFTATVDGLTELTDGTCVMLKNGVVTSASGFTLNVNGLGAKPVYNNLAAATRDTTIFNSAYTMLFVYDSTRVSGGAWICYRGYDANTNTIDSSLSSTSENPVQNKVINTALGTKQDALVSGTNIKTVNGNSLLGSGDLTVGGLPSVTASDNGKVLRVVNGAWAAAELPTYDGTVE